MQLKKKANYLLANRQIGTRYYRNSVISLSFLLFFSISSCSQKKAPDKKVDDLLLLNANLNNALKASGCGKIGPSESVLVYPESQCVGCNSFLYTFSQSGKKGFIVLASSAIKKDIENMTKGLLPICTTPFGLEDYNLDAVGPPSLLKRENNAVVEIIPLNGAGLNRLRALGLVN